MYAVVHFTMKYINLKQLLEEMIFKVSLSTDVGKDLYIVDVKDIHYPLLCIPHYGSKTHREYLIVCLYEQWGSTFQ